MAVGSFLFLQEQIKDSIIIWITTMSSGHDVSEYELGASGLPRAYVSPQQPWKN
jgi:hypothetical protein